LQGQRVIQTRNQNKQKAKSQSVAPKYGASSEINITTQKTVFFMVSPVRVCMIGIQVLAGFFSSQLCPEYYRPHIG
jgi:hypothetical protein